MLLALPFLTGAAVFDRLNPYPTGAETLKSSVVSPCDQPTDLGAWR